MSPELTSPGPSAAAFPRSVVAAATALLLAAAAVPGCARIAASHAVRQAVWHSGERHGDVLAANEAFYAALNQVLAGSADGMDNVWSHSPEVSDFGPDGRRHVGWDAVQAEFRREAGQKLGGSLTCADIKVVQAGDHAVVTLIELGSGMTVDGKVVSVDLRTTNVFRLEGEAWKMVHHHTDPSPALTPKPPR